MNLIDEYFETWEMLLTDYWFIFVGIGLLFLFAIASEIEKWRKSRQ